MGLRGPKPRPAAYFEQRGTRPRVDLRATPTPEPQTPTCPDWLDDEAKDCWNEVIEHLDEMRIITRVDGKLLAQYCQLWSRWKKAELFIQKYGNSYPIRNDDGTVKCFVQYPEVAIARTLATQLSRLSAEFGMSPSARTRINVPVRIEPMGEDEARFFGPRPGPGMDDDQCPPFGPQDLLEAKHVKEAEAPRDHDGAKAKGESPPGDGASAIEVGDDDTSRPGITDMLGDSD